MIVFSLATISKITAAGTGLRADLDIDSQTNPTGQEMYGQAPLQYYPPEGTEAIVLRRGDESLVIATKNRTYQMALVEGDVVLTALAPLPVSVKLTAAGKVETGKAAGTLSPVLTKSEFDDWVDKIFDGHGHPVPALGTSGEPMPATPATGTPAVPSQTPFAASGTGTSAKGSPVLEADKP